jgi:hypothetical protein
LASVSDRAAVDVLFAMEDCAGDSRTKNNARLLSRQLIGSRQTIS